MADTDVAPAPASSLPAATDHGATGDRPQPKPSTSKKRAAVAKPRKTSSQVGEHPKYSAMIADAITKLKERGGSSRQAILKFILAHYKVGSEINKINARIKVALKSGVKTGSLKQSKGTGAAGSFRLGEKKSSENKPRSKITKVRKPAGKSPSQKPKTAARKAKSAKSPAKKSASAAKKAKAKSPAKKLKAGAKKVKTASKTKPKPKKSPAKRTALTRKPAKKIGAKK